MSPSQGIDLAALRVALVLGLGTLALRIGGGELRRRLDSLGPVEGVLEYLPVAALAAMVLPAFVPIGGAIVDPLAMAAAGASAFVCFRTRNLLLGVGAGLLVYALLAAIGGV